MGIAQVRNVLFFGLRCGCIYTRSGFKGAFSVAVPAALARGGVKGSLWQVDARRGGGIGATMGGAEGSVVGVGA